jgi:hypothetical protein
MLEKKKLHKKNHFNHKTRKHTLKKTKITISLNSLLFIYSGVFKIVIKVDFQNILK